MKPFAILNLTNGQSMSTREYSDKLICLSHPESPSTFTLSWQKRTFDLLFSSLVLVMGSPLFLLLALLIKCTSQGPVFYCSTRLGQDGRPFKCWKFRSMCKDAEEKLQRLLKEDAEKQREWQKFFKLKEDPRITWIGHFLRRTSLDEFPQFWNVLIGDLSVVGPRPFLPSELPVIKDLLGNDFHTVLTIRPGLTGIWQTSGRSHLSFEERLFLDASYLQRSSFFLDLAIIGKTIPQMLFPRGAY
jgi:undecaprenyl-phosphate galactose phosphotransferase